MRPFSTPSRISAAELFRIAPIRFTGGSAKARGASSATWAAMAWPMVRTVSGSTVPVVETA